jgi:hypothetical protein
MDGKPTDLIQSLKDGKVGKPVDALAQKYLNEIFSSHAEGESIKSIATRLKIDRQYIKAVIETGRG